MPKFPDRRFKYRYFVICFVHTDQPQRVERTYTRAISDLMKYYPDFFRRLKNPKEMKGSEARPFMKHFIIQKLIEHTDIRVAHMVVDNWNIEDKFRSVPERAFNYLVKTIMKSFPLSAADHRALQLKVDTRNTAIENLRTLQGYLDAELVLVEGLTGRVCVDYLDSSCNKNIQVADILASVIFQRFRYKTMHFPVFADIRRETGLSHPYTNEYLYNQLKPRIVTPFVYPPTGPAIREAAATFGL